MSRSGAPYLSGHPIRVELRELLRRFGATSIAVSFESRRGQYQLLCYSTEFARHRLAGGPTGDLQVFALARIHQALARTPPRHGPPPRSRTVDPQRSTGARTEESARSASPVLVSTRRATASTTSTHASLRSTSATGKRHLAVREACHASLQFALHLPPCYHRGQEGDAKRAHGRRSGRLAHAPRRLRPSSGSLPPTINGVLRTRSFPLPLEVGWGHTRTQQAVGVRMRTPACPDGHFWRLTAP